MLLSVLGRTLALLFGSAVLCSAATFAAVSERPYLIDAHSQVDETIDLQKVLSLMDQAGVRYALLSAVALRQPSEIVAFARQHPDRILPAVRMKRGTYDDNDPAYYQQLKEAVTSGAYKAMSEVMIYHAAKSRRYPEISVYPDDERVQAALRYALERHWPFIVHIEFASRTIGDRAKFMAEFEAMLDAHPEHPFALAHMGQLAAAETRRLIRAHPNVYFLTSRSTPVTAGDPAPVPGRRGMTGKQASQQPWVNMFRGQVLSPEWRELVIQYPDRFVLTFDNVLPEHWGNFFLEEAQYWRSAFADLPEDVAKAVAHGNAERLWKIRSQ
jgi:predicted TIM-barrel fold metal-dependent hydrolase